MLAIPGWVIDSSGSGLSIKLKTGPVVEIAPRKDLHWGDSVRVCWDYERMRVRQVLSMDQIAALGNIEEVPWGEEDLPWDPPTTEELLDMLTR